MLDRLFERFPRSSEGGIKNPRETMPSSSARRHSGETSIQPITGPETADHYQKPDFPIPVDSEHKATILRPLSVAQPHMRAFHLTWTSFFTCFFSTFAAAPLLPVIRDDLDLTATDIANASIASVSASVFSRLCAGPLCHVAGPRYTSASLLLLTAPAVFATATVSSPAGFVLARFFTGFSLATFVSSQFWMGSMFASNILGLANGAATGLGNVGAGATQLAMPLLYLLVRNTLRSAPFTAWRVAFFAPGLMQVTMGLLVLCFGQDSPDGGYDGVASPDNPPTVAWYAVTNYRGWVLAVTYGYCFGVELTVNNIVASYFYDRFDVDVEVAGVIASGFGLANFMTCPCGGVLSDLTARRWGMRGRLWVLWGLQTTAGVFCILLGRASGSLPLSVLFLLLFSVFVQASCGATYGIIPFVSRRSLGAIAGMVGAGGNVGSIVTQYLLFTKSSYPTEWGISWMGVMSVVATLLVSSIYFPQWGGMLGKASMSTEEGYYGEEWCEEEKWKGLHRNSMRFAQNSRGERGITSHEFHSHSSPFIEYT